MKDEDPPDKAVLIVNSIVFIAAGIFCLIYFKYGRVGSIFSSGPLTFNWVHVVIGKIAGLAAIFLGVKGLNSALKNKPGD